MSDERRQLLEALQERLGYQFVDITLLERALTQRSYANDHQRRDEYGLLEDNERLEFLGDGVLYLAVSEFLFRTHPDGSEGQLSKRRRFQVQGSQQTAWGTELLLDDPRLLLRGRIPKHEADRGEASRLEDAFEAVLGAIFLDGGYPAVKGVLIPFMQVMDSELLTLRVPKSRLQESLQSRGLPLPTYPIVADGGPGHERWFEAVALCVTAAGAEPVEWGRARARSKRQAQTAAAEQALARLVDAGLIEGDPVE